MSKLLIEIENIDTVPLDGLLAGVVAMITEAWNRARASETTPIVMGVDNEGVMDVAEVTPEEAERTMRSVKARDSIKPCGCEHCVASRRAREIARNN